MSIHSKFLIHWTGGKDIENKPQSTRPGQYLNRLLDYYQNGLYLKRTDEASIRRLKVKHLARICFTEVRLSQTEIHARRYGKLGIGFAREFIVNAGGRPVIYVPVSADFRPLEDSIRIAYENSKKRDEDTHRALKSVLAFVKRMTSDLGDENYYDEMEWRVVYDETSHNPHFTKTSDDGRGVLRFKFNPTAVSIIVFPNDKTRKLALNDKTLKNFLHQHTPIMVTLDECKNF